VPRRSWLLIACAAGLAGCGLEAVPDAPGGLRGRLTAVVDGDTVRVDVNGRRESVRLLGIDTPESGRPDTPVQCGALEATGSLRRLLGDEDGGGPAVVLLADPGQDRRDRFGRLLAYVELLSGTDLGAAQVRAGWARPYVYGRRPFARLALYERAQREARRAGRGVHRSCGGRFDAPASRLRRRGRR